MECGVLGVDGVLLAQSLVMADPKSELENATTLPPVMGAATVVENQKILGTATPITVQVCLLIYTCKYTYE
jgi:hypothetical protein